MAPPRSMYVAVRATEKLLVLLEELGATRHLETRHIGIRQNELKENTRKLFLRSSVLNKDSKDYCMLKLLMFIFMQIWSQNFLFLFKFSVKIPSFLREVLQEDIPRKKINSSIMFESGATSWGRSKVV